LKLEGSVANIKGEAGFGKTKGNASVDLVKGTLEVPLKANSSIKGNIKAADYELKGERGPITINDVAELSVSGKIGPVEASGSIHLDNIVNSIGYLAESVGNYVSEKVNDAMSQENKVPKTTNLNVKRK
jgi:hypothetical protein